VGKNYWSMLLSSVMLKSLSSSLADLS